MQAAAAQMYGNRPDKIDDEIEHHLHHLTDAGSQCGTGNPHLRERADAEDEQWVQNNVADRAERQPCHRDLHAAYSLKYLFKSHGGHDDNRKEKRDARIGQPQRNNGFIRSEAAQEARYDGNTGNGGDDAVQQGQHHAVRRGGVSLLLIAGPQMQ